MFRTFTFKTSIKLSIDLATGLAYFWSCRKYELTGDFEMELANYG